MCVHSTTRKINSIIAPGGHHEQYWLSSDTGPPLSTGNKRILSSHTGTCNVHNFYETVTLNPFTLRDPLESIVCYFHTFGNNLGIKQKFPKYLKES